MTVFCDLDGTLIDSTERHLVLLQDILHRYQIDLSLDGYLTFKFDGNSTKSFLLEHMLPIQLAEQISSEWKEHIEDEKYLARDTVYPDALPFLQRQSKNCDIVYVSARKNQDAVMRTLEYNGLTCFAKEIYIVNPMNAIKEKVKAIQYMSTKEDFFVGDTETDWECAQCLGLTGLVLNRGFRSKAYWDKRGVVSFDNLITLQAEILKKE